METLSLRNMPSKHQSKNITDDILKCTSKLMNLIAFGISKITQ